MHDRRHARGKWKLATSERSRIYFVTRSGCKHAIPRVPELCRYGDTAPKPSTGGGSIPEARPHLHPRSGHIGRQPTQPEAPFGSRTRRQRPLVSTSEYARFFSTVPTIDDSSFGSRRALHEEENRTERPAKDDDSSEDSTGLPAARDAEVEPTGPSSLPTQAYGSQIARPR